MVDAGTICSVVCPLSILTLCGGLIGFGQDIFRTCSSRIDLQIEIQIVMIASMLISMVSASLQMTGRYAKTSAQLERILIICLALSFFCLAVETLIQFIMLIGFNDHCETKMTTLGMVLLWLYVILGTIFSLPVLVYSVIMIFAIGPLVYFEYKRNKRYHYHSNRAKWMLGREEGWESFQVVVTPEFMYRSYSVMIQYCIYYCSWDLTSDEAARCAEVGMRCPGCGEPYLVGEYVFLSPNSFDHAHAECIEANIELLKHDENPHAMVFWNNLANKMNEIYPREFKPASVERFFEPDGLFKSVLYPQGDEGGEPLPEPIPALPIPPLNEQPEEDIDEDDIDSSDS